MTMGIILFLVDTSASMNQKTFLGTSYLDVAKGAIDTFMKYRSRDPASNGDHYMLVSFDDPPTAIKVGWENHGTFATELKNLQALGVSVFSQSLKEALDLLNVNRLHTGIDHYGQGRNPFFLEPAVVIVLTDGGSFNSPSGDIEDELNFPRNSMLEGSELTKEPFRWDQRIFVVLLQYPGLSGVATNEGEKGEGGTFAPGYRYLSTLCEHTGGKCYTGTNAKSLSQCMESVSQKLHQGVVLNFRKIGSEEERSLSSARETPGKTPEHSTDIVNGNGGEEPREVSPSTRANAWHNTRKMIYVKPNPKTNVPVGHWPIPESFWPDSSLSTLAPRDVHPVVWFNATQVKPKLLESFAFDKYELEASPLTQCILEKRDLSLCWQVFINDSGKEKGITLPFGYLKPSSSGNFVNLFVMPFNYPRLLPLIEELQRQQLRPSPKWRAEFADYVSTVPSYYVQPLRKALLLMGAHPSLVPESFDGQMSYSITNYLKKLRKQAKMESSKLSTQIQRNMSKQSTNNETKKKIDLGDGSTIAIGSTAIGTGISSQSYRNPFDIPRSSLLGQVARMRTNFLFSSTNTPHLIEEVTKHQVPIGQMGNYQKHLKRINPLRELDTGDVRTQLFGNPFKLEKPSDKRNDNMADEVMVEQLKRPSGTSHRNSRKRSRLRSPSPMPLPSPTPPPPQQTTPTTNEPNKLKSSHSNKISIKVEEEKVKNNKSVPIPSGVATMTDDVEVVELHTSSSSQMKQEVIEEEMDVALISETINGSEKESIISDPIEIMMTTTTIQTESTPNKQNDISLAINRKRTPSPTSFSPPPSKRPHKDTNIKNTTSNNTLSANSDSLPPATAVGKVKPSLSALPPSIRSSSALLSSASQVLNEEFKRKQMTENLKIKQLITKEIRKHSKNYDSIFQYLDTIQGTPDNKRAFVQDIIKEAERFRKKSLVALLYDWTLGLPGGGGPMGGAKSSSNSSNNKSQSR